MNDPNIRKVNQDIENRSRQLSARRPPETNEPILRMSPIFVERRTQSFGTASLVGIGVHAIAAAHPLISQSYNRDFAYWNRAAAFLTRPDIVLLHFVLPVSVISLMLYWRRHCRIFADMFNRDHNRSIKLRQVTHVPTVFTDPVLTDAILAVHILTVVCCWTLIWGMSRPVF